VIKVSLGIPITFIIIVAFLVLLPFYVDPVVIGMALLITAAGIPVYLVGVVWKNKPNWLIKIFGDFNFFKYLFSI
jgi:L-type amino acid transporter 5